MLVINGQPVPAREYRIFLLRERSNILSDTSPASTTPEPAILAAAEDDAASTVVEFQLARQFGLIDDASYTAFLAALTAENRRRADAVAAHQAIYGPEVYSEADYLDYLEGEFRYALPPLLVQSGELAADDTSVQTWVDANRRLFVDRTGTFIQPDADLARRGYLDASYRRYVAMLADRATIHWTSIGASLRDSGCAAEGSC